MTGVAVGCGGAVVDGKAETRIEERDLGVPLAIAHSSTDVSRVEDGGRWTTTHHILIPTTEMAKRHPGVTYLLDSSAS